MLDPNEVDKRKINEKRPSIHKFSKPDFKIIKEDDLKNPNIGQKKRKQMITVLRNNSKVLNLQERDLNSKLTRLKNDNENPFNMRIENMKMENRIGKRNDSLNANSSESKGIFNKPCSTLEYNDSKYKPQELKQSSQKGIGLMFYFD